MVRLVLNVLGCDDSDNRLSFEEIAGEDSEVGGEFLRTVGLVSPHVDEFIDGFYFSSVSLDVSDDRLEQVEEIEVLVLAETFEDRVAFRGAEEADHLVDDILDGISGVDSSLESSSEWPVRGAFGCRGSRRFVFVFSVDFLAGAVEDSCHGGAAESFVDKALVDHGIIESGVEFLVIVVGLVV